MKFYNFYLKMSNNILFLSNIKGNFEKVVELFEKLEKTGKIFNLLVLIGQTFCFENNFSKLNLLKQIKTKILIFDSSKISSVLKSKIKYELYNFSDNIIILGRSGIFNINGNLKIAYINGKENEDSFNLNVDKKYSSDYFIYNDINNLIKDEKKTEKIDLLLLSNFPHIFYEEVQKNKESFLYNESLIINKDKLLNNISMISNFLINNLCPRYIITSLDDFYYERKPYINKKNYLTRFIHLSYFYDKKNIKEKSLYGISLKHFENLNNKNLDISYTEDPFKENYSYKSIEENLNLRKIFFQNINNSFNNNSSIKDSFPLQIKLTHLDKNISEHELNNFLSKIGEILFCEKHYNKKGNFLCEAFLSFKDPFINNKLVNEDKIYKINNRRVFFEKIENDKLSYSKCKFCFDNSEIEKELILHDFENFYLAYSKGPINNFHFLILPHKHYSSYMTLPKELKKEFKEILNSIIKFLNLHSLDYIYYEKNLPFDNIVFLHMCVNIIGIEKDYMINFQDTFKNNFPNFYNINTTYDEENIFSLDFYENKSNFYYYINAGKGYKIGIKEIRIGYYIEISENIKDFKDYPRLVICKLIEKENNIYWKNCSIDLEFLKKLKKKVNQYFQQ